MARRKVEVTPDPWENLLADHQAAADLASQIREDKEARRAAFLASPESTYNIPSSPRD